MTIQFSKYHGTGNDFILVDNRSLLLGRQNAEQYAHWCHRRFGIGADGLIFIQDHAQHDFEMVYYNADGHEGSMCGNGGRCAVAFARHLGIIGDKSTFWAVDGLHHAEVVGEQVALQMKNVDLIQHMGKDFVLDTGSPHYVCITDNLSAIDVVTQGRQIRYSPDFHTNGINVNFIAPHPHIKGALVLATYERGVEDETWSCGTGTVASAIAWVYQQGKLTEQTYHMDLYTKGGLLSVSFRTVYQNKQWRFDEVWLRGPAVAVFAGSLIIP